MRILIFTQYFTTPQGSYGTRIYEFARRWVRAGDQVTVVTSVYDRAGIKPARWLERMNIDDIDVRVVRIGLSNHHSVVLRAVTFLLYALFSCWYAITLPADVVVCSSGPITVAIPGLVAKYLLRRRFVFEVRDLWPEGAIQLGLLHNRLAIFLLRRFELFCYRSATRVVALSEGMAQWIENRYGITHVDVVTNAADNAPVQAELPEDEARIEGKIVVYAGAVGFANNCGQLLQVAEHLAAWGADDVQIVIIGDGKERPRLDQQAVSLDCRNIHFLGPRTKQQVALWLERSLCSVSTVRANPFFDMASPNKIFDSLAVGAPVIQDTQGWIKEMLETRDCGITVERGNPEAMAHAILAIARDSALRNRMSVNARSAARELFDRDLLALRLQQILRRSAVGARA